MYSALDVANYVLGYYCEKTESGISNLKLQKILYFLQAEFLVGSGRPLFIDDIEACSYGPIVYSVNSRYSVYGGAIIPYKLIDKNKEYKTKIRNSDKKRIDAMLDTLKNYSSAALLDIIHNQNPWMKGYYKSNNQKYIMRNGMLERIKVIPNQQLKEFFSADQSC